MDASYTRIVLKDVEVAVRVGLAPSEREMPQLLLVNVELYAASSDYLGLATPRSIIMAIAGQALRGKPARKR